MILLKVFRFLPGGLWWKGALGGLGDHGEGRPWCDVVDCFSGSAKLVMHLST